MVFHFFFHVLLLRLPCSSCCFCQGITYSSEYDLSYVYYHAYSPFMSIITVLVFFILFLFSSCPLLYFTFSQFTFFFFFFFFLVFKRCQCNRFARLLLYWRPTISPAAKLPRQELRGPNSQVMRHITCDVKGRPYWNKTSPFIFLLYQGHLFAFVYIIFSSTFELVASLAFVVILIWLLVSLVLSLNFSHSSLN